MTYNNYNTNNNKSKSYYRYDYHKSILQLMLIPTNSSVTMKVALYFVRQFFGYHKESDKANYLSIAKFAGLMSNDAAKKQSIRKSVNELVKLNVLSVEKSKGGYKYDKEAWNTIKLGSYWDTITIDETAITSETTIATDTAIATDSGKMTDEDRIAKAKSMAITAMNLDIDTVREVVNSKRVTHTVKKGR